MEQHDNGHDNQSRPARLSHAFLLSAPDGRYGDGFGGNGLSALVKTARKSQRRSVSFSQRLWMRGATDSKKRQRNIGLGGFPTLSLKAARELAAENIKQNRRGKYVFRADAKIPTFRVASEKTIALHTGAYKTGSTTAHKWRLTFEKDIYPAIGDRLVSELTPADIIAILEPLHNTRRATAKKLRQRISKVMAWAIGKGYRTDNPAGRDGPVLGALPKSTAKPTQARKALRPADVGQALRRIRNLDTWLGARLCLEFIFHTGARSGEARKATWEQIDFERRVWSLPVEVMKQQKVWRVPLSDAAVDVLCRAQELSGDTGLIFPAERGGTLYDDALSKPLRKNAIGMVPAGLRASLRTWVGTITDVPRNVAELVIAHTLEGEVLSTYLRTDLEDFLEQRRSVMAAWSSYISG